MHFFHWDEAPNNSGKHFETKWVFNLIFFERTEVYKSVLLHVWAMMPLALEGRATHSCRSSAELALPGVPGGPRSPKRGVVPLCYMSWGNIESAAENGRTEHQQPEKALQDGQSPISSLSHACLICHFTLTNPPGQVLKTVLPLSPAVARILHELYVYLTIF
jgi:hypothetical protein